MPRTSRRLSTCTGNRERWKRPSPPWANDSAPTSNDQAPSACPAPAAATRHRPTGTGAPRERGHPHARPPRIPSPQLLPLLPGLGLRVLRRVRPPLQGPCSTRRRARQLRHHIAPLRRTAGDPAARTALWGNPFLTASRLPWRTTATSWPAAYACRTGRERRSPQRTSTDVCGPVRPSHSAIHLGPVAKVDLGHE